MKRFSHLDSFEKYSNRTHGISRGTVDIQELDLISDSESSAEELSEFDSQASRINFWKDINTKDEAYTLDRVMIKEMAHENKKDGGNDHKCKHKSNRLTGGKIATSTTVATQKKFDSILNNMKIQHR